MTSWRELNQCPYWAYTVIIDFLSLHKWKVQAVFFCSTSMNACIYIRLKIMWIDIQISFTILVIQSFQKVNFALSRSFSSLHDVIGTLRPPHYHCLIDWNSVSGLDFLDVLIRRHHNHQSHIPHLTRPLSSCIRIDLRRQPWHHGHQWVHYSSPIVVRYLEPWWWGREFRMHSHCHMLLLYGTHGCEGTTTLPFLGKCVLMNKLPIPLFLHGRPITCHTSHHDDEMWSTVAGLVYLWFSENFPQPLQAVSE